MVSRGRLAIASATISVLLLAGGLVPSANASAAQGSSPTILTDWLFIYQGSSDFNTGSSVADTAFGALKIMSFDLPYNVSRVYASVPVSAFNVSVWSGSTLLNESEYGWETASIYGFYIDVPATHPRNSSFSNSTTGLTWISPSGSVFNNTEYISGALCLVDDNLTGQYTSANMTPPSAHNIVSANLTFNGTSTGNITSYLSNDGGANWVYCPNGSVVEFSTIGTSLRVRFDMTGNSTLGFNTTVSSYFVQAVYTPLSTVFSVHISYQWTQKFTDGRATISLSEVLPFSANGTSLVMIYVVTGYSVSGTGIDLIFDENRTMNTYAGKDLYFNQSAPSGALERSIDILAPSTGTDWGLYVVAIILVVAFVSAFGYTLVRRPRSEEARMTKVPAKVPEPEISAVDGSHRRELVEKKKVILSKIESVKAKIVSGEMSPEASEAELKRLKNEFKSVRNELNKLSRKAEAEDLEEPISDDLEPVLAALARIDDDFEKGRLPESTYKTLRKDYVDRASQLMAAAKKPPSPFEAEKAKLMEAIIALDEERERGEIDERVYSDLSASYRKQLSELMRKEKELEESNS